MKPVLLRPFMRLAALLLLVDGSSACRRAEPVAAAPTEVRHPMTGQILSIDRDRRTLLVDHEEIPGYMPAMAMEFSVNIGDLANAAEGRRIRAEMVVDPEAEGGFRLEKIWPIDAQAESTVAAATGALRQETSIRGRNAYREVGENLPDFALYDQKGEVVSAARFRGRQIMLNFIFTRCPVATMCPLATAKMMETQRLAKEAGVVDLELISISLDPAYDTPGVLREYATNRGIDTSNFSFLTGPEGAIKDLLVQFGVLASTDTESILKHTLATLLIDAHGRIVWREDGSQWSPAAFVEKMAR